MSEKNIYQSLKEQIILLEHRPGKVIREKEIMTQFSVSRTPVREALRRLEMDGLVRIIPKIGTIVEDVSFQQLKDVFETLSYLIKLVGELAATRISKAELAEIRRRIMDMRSAKGSKDFMKLDGEIHKIINRSTNNEVLVKMLEGLHEQTIRIWVFSGAKSGYWENLEKDFTKIADALEERDGKKAAQLLDDHTKNFVDHIRSQWTF